MNMHVTDPQEDRAEIVGFEARGFFAESRFIHIVNATCVRRVRGFARIEHAPALMDARGIDAFVYHYRGCTGTTPKRIPIQIKTGFDPTQHKDPVVRGMTIPTVPISVDINDYCAADRIRRLLDAHESRPRSYDERILRFIETDPPIANEYERVSTIERCRALYRFDPALA